MPLRFECITELELAKMWWEQFSPNESLYDQWGFRYCFHKYFNRDVRFYVGYKNNEPIGLFPLQYNNDQMALEAYGGSYMRENRPFIKSGFESYLPDFYNHITEPAAILNVIGTDAFTSKLPLSYYRYCIDLTGCSTIDAYLTTKLYSKYRSNIKRRVKLLAEENITVAYNQFDDLELLMKLNLTSFTDSSFAKLHRQDIFRDLLKLKLDFQLMTFSISGKKVAVSFSVRHKGIYHYINLGTDKEASQHLWTYVTYANIERAIALGCTVFDSGLEDCSWKEHWGHIALPEYNYLTATNQLELNPS